MFTDIIEQCSENLNCSNRNEQNRCTNNSISCHLFELDCIERFCEFFEDHCNKTFGCRKKRQNIELLCETDECNIANGGCSQICVNLPFGHKCDCYPGYFLTDNETCEGENFLFLFSF